MPDDYHLLGLRLEPRMYLSAAGNQSVICSCSYSPEPSVSGPDPRLPVVPLTRRSRYLWLW